MSQSLILDAKGLKTAPNQLSKVGGGSMTVADNVVIDQPGVIKPRRGIYPIRDASAPYAKLGTGQGVANSCTFFNDGLILHTASNRLVKWSDSAGGTTYVDSLGAPGVVPPSGFKVRFAQANGNLYFTTREGVKKLESLASDFRLAGAPASVDLVAAVNGAGTALPDGYSFAYRVLWGYRDENNNLILGAPVSRAVVTNSAGSTQNVTLSFVAPEWVEENYIYQIYRSTAAEDVPNDELGLVYEGVATDATGFTPGGAANIYSVTDSVSDGFRDTSLYINASQEGYLQANDQPPLARDIALFNGSMVYANLTEKNRLSLDLLSTVSGTGLKTRDTIEIGGEFYLFANGSTAGIGLGTAVVVTDGTSDAYLGIEKTAQALARAVNYNSSSPVYAAYVSLPDGLPGKISIEERDIGGSGFYVTGGGYLSAWRQDVPKKLYITSKDWNTSSPKTGVGFRRVGTTVTVKTTTDAHGLSTGNVVVITPASNTDADFPAYAGSITVTGADTFTYTQAGAAVDHRDTLAGGGTLYAYTVFVQGTDLTSLASVAERNPNGLALSKNGRPEAVPLTNRLTVDSATDILRVIALRDRLFIFKEDGIWTLTGDNTSNYRIDLFDTTTELLAPESAVVVGNRIFALTNQGVVSISGDGGVQIISRDIETELLELLGTVGYTTMSTYAWAVGYETERKYILHVPTASNSTAPGKAYVYNLFTNTWTTQSTTFNCGAVAPTADVLYYGNSDAANVSRERKSFNYTDYADDAAPVTCTSAGTGTSVTLSGTGIATVGDIYYQSALLFSRVTAVVEGGGNSVLTLETSAAWTTGARFLYRRFSSSLTWVVDTAGNPGALKHYSTAKLFLGDMSRFNGLSLAFGNELVGTSSIIAMGSPTNANYPAAIHTYVPREAQRCALLEIGLTHATAWDDFELNGIGLRFRQGSERFTR